jgi:molecular chaperone DnaK
MTYEGERLLYSPIIHRNTPLPVSKSEIFATYHDNQTEVDVTVYEGEDPIPANNTLIGQFRVEGLRKVGQGNPIVINCHLDLNGMLKVTAIEKETGLNKTVTLDTRGAKSTLDLEQARTNIQSLLGETGAPEEEPHGRPPDDQSLRTAKDLRKRADALLQKGVSEDDAKEIRDLLRRSAEAVKEHDPEALSALNDSLSDIIFYLED